VWVNAPVIGRRWQAQADGMVTDQVDLPLVMRYADCTPLVVYDARRGVIGVGHAGWRGTVNGMAASVVQAMVDCFGCRPADLQAGIGPSIGPTRYQVGEEVVAAAQARFGGDLIAQQIIQRDPADGTAYFNLWQSNRLEFERIGLDPAQIQVAGLCTAAHTDEFFSHRAEKGRTGRFGMVVSL
jgi:polyphenol oxidase